MYDTLNTEHRGRRPRRHAAVNRHQTRARRFSE
jgi:hypothetical protein